MTGNTVAARIPLCMFPLLVPVQRPTKEGPNVPPASPARARSANSAVPPLGMRAEVMLIEPGHIMPTARPHNMQAIRLKIGIGDSDAAR